MAEDSWLRCERQFFAEKYASDLKVQVKTINSILEKYNRFLQKALIGESPFVAEDLKQTILKSRGEENVTELQNN